MSVQGVDNEQLATYLRRAGLAAANDLRVSLMAGGRSNLTYAVEVDGQRWVLRRPPLGEILSTAHDVAREFTVMQALQGSSVPVPEVVHLCEDAGVLGAPFYLMKLVDGSVLRTQQDVLALPAKDRAELARNLIDVLANLHMIDPESVGLGSFGRPQGFMARQVRRWTSQLEATLEPTEQMRALASTLADSVPESEAAAIVHGDYRLDNCITRGSQIRAVLDWEMATLGHPLADLGMFVIYHDGLADLDNPVVQSPGRLDGVPAIGDLVARYAERTGLDVSELDWYIAFAWFKLAVILAGVSHRAEQGQTAGQQFEGVAGLIDPCIERGLTALVADR